MFYVKTPISKEAFILTDITSMNVYTRCRLCNKEIPIDLAAMLKHNPGGLDATVFCSKQCYCAYHRQQEQPVFEESDDDDDEDDLDPFVEFDDDD